MERVRHHGRSTAYRVVDRGGDAPAALLVHGSGGRGALWRPQFAHLGADRPLVVPDLSGHGASAGADVPDDGEGALSAYAADVAAVARETDAAVLVGASLGAAASLTADLDGLSADAVVAAGCGPSLPVADSLFETLRDDPASAVAWLHGPDRLFHDPDEATLSASREAMRAVDAATLRRDFRASDAFDATGELATLDAPLLALTGAHDRLTPPAVHESLADAVPDGEWTTVEGAAHLSMVEAPAAFADAVRPFLQ